MTRNFVFETVVSALEVVDAVRWLCIEFTINEDYYL
jgi:hypothetical protein